LQSTKFHNCLIESQDHLWHQFEASAANSLAEANISFYIKITDKTEHISVYNRNHLIVRKEQLAAVYYPPLIAHYIVGGKTPLIFRHILSSFMQVSGTRVIPKSLPNFSTSSSSCGQSKTVEMRQTKNKAFLEQL
jgi:hypothetical protein